MQRLLFIVLTVLIGMAVAYAGFGIQRTSRHTAVASLQYEKVNQRVLEAAEMIARDFRNLGSGVLDQADLFPGAQIDTTSCRGKVGSQCYIVFKARIDSASHVPHEVRYEWTKTDSVALKTGPHTARVPTYRLLRYVDKAANTLRLDQVTAFEVRLLDADGEPLVGPLHETRRIQVALVVAAQSGASDGVYDYQQRWRNTFQPRNLRSL